MKRFGLLIMIFCITLNSGCESAKVKTMPLSFLTLPITEDEKEISQVLEGIVEAYNRKDIEKYFSYFDKDAKIDSIIVGRVVSKEEHKRDLSRIKETLPYIELRKIRIKKVSSSGGRVEAQFYSSKAGIEFPIMYILSKHDEKWFIIEDKKFDVKIGD